jgi:hypothetical protein
MIGSPPHAYVKEFSEPSLILHVQTATVIEPDIKPLNPVWIVAELGEKCRLAEAGSGQEFVGANSAAWESHDERSEGNRPGPSYGGGPAWPTTSATVTVWAGDIGRGPPDQMTPSQQHFHPTGSR